MWSDEIEHVGGQTPCYAHLFDFIRGLDADGHGAVPHAACGGGGVEEVVFQGQRIVVQIGAARTRGDILEE
jgi:hypothetical protein